MLDRDATHTSDLAERIQAKVRELRVLAAGSWDQRRQREKIRGEMTWHAHRAAQPTPAPKAPQVRQMAGGKR